MQIDVSNLAGLRNLAAWRACAGCGFIARGTGAGVRVDAEMGGHLA